MRKTDLKGIQYSMREEILGVGIDQIDMVQSVELVKKWILNYKAQKIKPVAKYIVTPNIEFIMLAQKDKEFAQILNNADLSIPDSARLSWVYDQMNEKNPTLRLLKWPLFLFPNLLPMKHFDIVAGTDLVEELIKLASDCGFSVGFLGGRDGVAEQLGQVLKKKYPKLKVVSISDGGILDKDGNQVEDLNPKSLIINLPAMDILFVAFGHGKQEKWIAKNKGKYPIKVMVGVGGAFDYLSGFVPRAPMFMRRFGLEWLFRLFVQPWRIKRFWSLFRFVFEVLTFHR